MPWYFWIIFGFWIASFIATIIVCGKRLDKLDKWNKEIDERIKNKQP